MKIIGKNIIFRVADEDDAAFILKLRLNESLNKYLSSVDDNLQKQANWLIEYKIREKQRVEYYFIILDNDGNRCGTVRIYDFIGDSFSWGSWLIDSKIAPMTAGIESALLVYEFAFYKLEFNNCHFEVVSENTKVKSFHEKMGAVISSCDESKTYYKYNVEAYEKIKNKYVKFLPERFVVCE